MVRITDDEFQTSTKMISQGQSLTQKHLQCWTFLKQKQLPPVCTTGCTVQGLNPSGGKIFCTRPDWPWGPSSLLYNGYWVFPWGKTVVVWHWPPTTSSAEVQKRVELYLYSTCGPS